MIMTGEAIACCFITFKNMYHTATTSLPTIEKVQYCALLLVEKAMSWADDELAYTKENTAKLTTVLEWQFDQIRTI